MKIFKLTLLALSSCFLLWQCDTISKEELTLDYGQENAQMRNMQTTNHSPYAMFGDSSVVLMTEFERKGQHILEIFHNNNKWIFDLKTGVVKVFDEDEKIQGYFIMEAHHIARFLSTDPLAEKYPNISPYAYVANNPIIFIDPDGREIDFSKAIETLMRKNKDNEDYTRTDAINHLQNTLLSDLSDKTGLNLGIGENNMLVVLDGEGKVKSSLMRDDLMNAIESCDVLSVDIGLDRFAGTSSAFGNRMFFNLGEMERYINGTSKDLNKTTMGYALMFMHELDHSALGYHKSMHGNESSIQGLTGETVDRINQMRTELTLSGDGNYGQRLSYLSYRDRNRTVSTFPFTTETKARLQQNPSLFPGIDIQTGFVSPSTTVVRDDE